MTGQLTHVASPEPIPDTFDSTIFLAGPTPRSGEVPSWRPAALELLTAAGYSGVVLDPERRVPTYDYDVQVDWEAAALEASDVIVFWVPRNLETLPAFTTNVEFGAWIASGRVVAGGPVDAPKNKYLAHTARRLGVRWHDTLDDVIAVAAATATTAAVARTGALRRVPAAVRNHPAFDAWLAELHGAGHRLDDIDLVSTFPAALGQTPFLWMVRPTVQVGGEGRAKRNEVIIGRPDTAAVVAHGPARGDATEVVVVSEFRSAGRSTTGRITELPAGTIERHQGPATAAATELAEETGLTVDPARLRPVGTAQLAGTLLTHRCWLSAVELTAAELDLVRNTGRVGQLVDDAEVTYPAVVTVAELTAAACAAGGVDWSTVGMVHAALRDQS